MENLEELIRSRIPDSEVHLMPVIQKEFLHYSVLAALDKLGLIDKLVFHGGTCLRLCYGAERRSEDLDFAYDGDLGDLNLTALKDTLDRGIGRRFGLSITVKPPRKTVEFANAKMQRWWMTVDTAPSRPGLPSQKLKIEVISMRALTREVRRIARNYDFLFPSAGNVIVACESCSEILADKLVSFVNTPPSYIRKRDLWDMMFLLSSGRCDERAALGLVPSKAAFYGCDLTEVGFRESGARRAQEIGMQKAFQAEMRRFMTQATYDSLMGSEMKRRFAIQEVADLYGRCKL